MQYPATMIDIPIGLSNQLSEIVSSISGAIVFFVPDTTSKMSNIILRGFRNNYDNFVKLGYEIIGISTESQDQLDTCIDNLNLKFPLVSDVQLKFSNEMNVLGKQPVNSQLPRKAKYRTFIVDNQLQVIKVSESYATANHASDLSIWIESNLILSQTKPDHRILQDG